MMASKGAIVPVNEVMKLAGVKFDPSVYVPAVSGYYTAPQRPDAEPAVQQLDHGLPLQQGRVQGRRPRPRSSRPRPGRRWRWPRPSSRPPATSARSRPAGRAGPSWRASAPGTTSSSRRKRNGFNGLDTRLAFTTPLHVRHIENLANMAQQGLFVYKGRSNAADAVFQSGECAMVHRHVGGLRRHQAQRRSSEAASARCRTTPTCPARRRTP